MTDNGISARYLNLYTTKAYVFYVSPENREWIQTAKKPIDVSIVLATLGLQTNDNSQNGQSSTPVRRVLRLVAVNDETNENILDHDITKTTFDQRSAIFCQWMDKERLLWGLGSHEEGALEEFIRRVDQYKQEIAQQQPQQNPFHNAQPPPKQRQHTASTSSQSNNQISPKQQNNQPHTQQQSQHQTQQSQTQSDPQQQQQQQQLKPDSTSNGQPNARNRLTRSHSTIGYEQNNKSDKPIENQNSNDSVSQQQKSTNLEQLKYENECLKQALDEISVNAGLWQKELNNLRTNNDKLTKALQESKSNVEEWQIELANLRDENKELKQFRDTNNNTDQKQALLELQKSMASKVTELELDLTQFAKVVGL